MGDAFSRLKEGTAQLNAITIAIDFSAMAEAQSKWQWTKSIKPDRFQHQVCNLLCTDTLLCDISTGTPR